MSPGPVEELALLDLERSNKGASKQRRDQINGEIATMRDLLPLPESARQRLSQLQIMSLSCVYIRKCNILQKLVQPNRCTIAIPCDFSQALAGFILVTTRDGKLVYISENVTEYLGHSMVDMKTQGDSLFDIVDKRDHGTVQAQLLHGSSSDVQSNQQTSFFCRMNMSRTLKRQGGFGDVKVMHVRGHFVSMNGQETGSDQQVFMALCTPLITPDVKESLIQNNTMVFKSVHKLDMSFIELAETGEFHLGLTNNEIKHKSWYSMLHPEDIHEARTKHIQLVKSRHEMGCMMTVRMLSASNEVIWVNVVMHVKQAVMANSDDPVVVCINQVVSEDEAKQFKIQGQLFALYASRAPDFLFGGHPFPQIVPGTEQDMITHGHTPVFMPQTGFYPEQQGFSAYAHPHHGNTPLPQTTQFRCDQSLLDQCEQRPQGHTNTLKALKRKLQENYISSCRPNKLPRMTQKDLHREGCTDFHGDGGQLIANVNMYRNSVGNVHDVRGGGACMMNGGPVQTAYQPSYYPQPQVLAKEKGIVITQRQPVVTPKFSSPVTAVEQVVPDVSIPDCYLTPDPSPASSPRPETTTVVKQETHQIKHLNSFVIDKLNELKQNQTMPEVPVTKTETEPPKKKVLPVIDATFVDSFFYDLDVPTNLLPVTQIKTEPMSPPPASALVSSTACALPVSSTSPSLESSNPMVSTQKTTVIKEELTFEDCSDLEELFGLIGSAGSDRVNSDAFSPDCQASPVSFPDSIHIKSPASSCESPSSPEFHKSHDSLSSTLSPDSSPGHEGRDDLLDPDSWLLEPMEMNFPLPCLDETLAPAKREEDELYQLKQLLMSWTPCGAPESRKNTQ